MPKLSCSLSRNSVDLKSAKIAQNQRQRDMSPIEAAREATSKQVPRTERPDLEFQKLDQTRFGIMPFC